MMLFNEIIENIKKEYDINDLQYIDIVFIIKYNEIENSIYIHEKETEHYLDNTNIYVNLIKIIRNVNNKDFINFLTYFINNYEINKKSIDKEYIKRIIISNDNIIIS